MTRVDGDAGSAHPRIEHVWFLDTQRGEPWQMCRHAGCRAWRHKPLRDGGATTCPGTGGEHVWQPLTFRLETQLLDGDGRYVIAPQPDIEEGRVYAICMPCRSHTYIETAWVGYFLGSPFMEEELDEAERRESPGV